MARRVLVAVSISNCVVSMFVIVRLVRFTPYGCEGANTKAGERGVLSGVWLILARKQDRRCRSIRFRDDPEFHASLRAIGGQDAQGISQRKLILPLIRVADIAPIARLMAGKRLEHINRRDGFHNAR